MQGIIVNFTFELNTVRTACISCLKLNSLLCLVKKLFPPSQIISILSIICGSFSIANAMFVIAPIAKIYVLAFLFAISIILFTASFGSLYPFST